jgi:hypothetical protein
MKYFRNAFSHDVSTMFALAKVTEQLLRSLPTEFTKKQFDAMRKACDGHPLSLQTCRDYGFVTLVREEPTDTTYTTRDTVWIDSKGRRYEWDEMYAFDRKTIAMLFECPEYERRPMPLFELPNEDVEIKHPCTRNIYTFNADKFKCFLEGNA